MPEKDPVAALRASGADRFDPVRFRYIEAMSCRAEALAQPARQILQNRAQDALQTYRADLQREGDEARRSAARLVQQYPDREEQLTRLLERCEFRQVRSLERRLARQASDSLVSALTEQITRRYCAEQERPGELKSTRRFRDSLARANADKLLARAIEDAPDNPGPLNPEMLAIRSLTVMREISPAYLGRFVSYIDTLLWLEQANARTRSQKK